MKESVFNRMMRWSKSRGWNQTALGVRLGLPPQNISNWGRRRVPPELHETISNLFGRSVDELLGLVEENPDDETTGQPSWPFHKIDEEKLRNLSADDAVRLETALLIAAAPLNLDIKKK